MNIFKRMSRTLAEAGPTPSKSGLIKITQRTRGISGISVYGRSKVCFGFGGEVFISILYGQPKMRRSRNSDWGCRVTWTVMELCTTVQNMVISVHTNIKKYHLVVNIHTHTVLNIGVVLYSVPKYWHGRTNITGSY